MLGVDLLAGKSFRLFRRLKTQKPPRMFLVLPKQSQQEVLGFNQRTSKLRGFVAAEEDHAPRFLGISFKHGCPRMRRAPSTGLGIVSPPVSIGVVTETVVALGQRSERKVLRDFGFKSLRKECFETYSAPPGPILRCLPDRLKTGAFKTSLGRLAERSAQRRLSQWA